MPLVLSEQFSLILASSNLKSMKSFFSICFFTFILSLSLFSQNPTDYKVDDSGISSLFKAVPRIDDSTPEWAQVMYKEFLNFEKVTRLYKEHYKINAFEKTIHTQNFKHWYKQVKDFANDEGMIELPESGKIFQHYEKLKSKSNSKSQTNQWTSLGPDVTYSSNGSLNKTPTQANVYCLGVSPSNPNVLYAGMETGGVFKTTDKGLNWFPVTHDYAIGNIQDIKVDPLSSDIVYVSRGSEVYKSTDGGTSWNLIYNSAGTVEQFFIHPTSTSTIYAATNGGLLKSTDGGANWTSQFTGRLYDVEAQHNNPNVMYIAVENTTLKRPEIWKSTDGGTTWVLKDNQFYTPLDPSVATVYGCKIGLTPADTNRVYAGIIATGKQNDNGWIGIYHSADGGDNWINESGVDGASIFDESTNTWSYPPGSDMNTNWFVAGYSSGYHQGFYNFDIDVSHNNADRLWIGTIWFCESANKGANIEYIRGTRDLAMHADVQDIDVIGDDIWVTSDGGINYSNDECQTTEVRMNGISGSDFWGFGQGWNEDTWVGGRYHNGNGVYHSNYGEGKTIYLGGAENSTGYVNPINNKKSYYSDIGGRLAPDSLNQSAVGIPNIGRYPTESYFHFSYSEIEWHPYYANIAYLGDDNSLFKSTDSGSSFNELAQLPGEIRRFEISRDDPNYIYCIVYISYWDWKVYKSTNGGENFTQITTPPYNGGSWRNLSFTLNPFDKDEIWLASNSSNDGNKIFSSTDGGTSWTNRYTSDIAGQSIKDLIYHASPDGDLVYAMTNDNFFYFDITNSNWVQYNTGLPVLHTGFMMLPFYKDQKIRLAGAKGIWEVETLSKSKVQAIPMVNQQAYFCSRDTVYLESYSIIDDLNAQWKWTISPTPLYIDDDSIRNPKVILGSTDTFDITLEITQYDGQTDTRTVANMISIESQCEPDLFPGNAFNGMTDNDYFVSYDSNLDSITHFTVTGWWKPAELNAFSALFSSGDWCAHCDDTEALMIDYWGNSVWYKWPGNAGNWGSNSGMNIPLNEWSYVALVIDPTGATMYLNDQKYVHNIPLNPGSIQNFHIGRGHYSNSFVGQIDEVTVWKRALSEQEVRELRHLTKENAIASDPDLIAYYQFNEIVNGTQVMDKAGLNHGSLLANSYIDASTVPVGTGASESFSVFGQDTLTSTITGIEMVFPDTGPYPNGDLVLSRINMTPTAPPTQGIISKSYWIINNYGTNKTFNNLSSLEFQDIGNMTPYNSASDFQLQERDENADTDSWAPKGIAGSIDFETKSVTTTTNLTVDSFGQFTVLNRKAVGWIGVMSSDWDNPANWGNGVLPTTSSDVIIPRDTPFQPIVNTNTVIRSITLMEGASLGIMNGVTFETN